MGPDENPESNRIESLYADFLSRLQTGDGPDFESWVQDYAEDEALLRALHDDYLRTQSSERKSELDDRRLREGVDRTFPAEVVKRLGARAGNYARYEIRGELARGGQGAVLRVWDEDLQRNLAMKVVREGEGHSCEVDSKTIGRFLEEAQVTGQLDHPGIVPIHELGLDSSGRLYFTMKLVKGQTLKEVFNLVHSGSQEWTVTRVLGAIHKVCEAMAYAHAKGVIHRDLKPANVMIGKFGEVYVMDWGLARVLGQEDKRDIRIQPLPDLTSEVRSGRRSTASDEPDSPLITMDGDVVGTPAYMSPEQARGELDQVGPHSDVYSVGAMLYHLLAGHTPYLPPGRRASNYAVWRWVMDGPPEPLSEMNVSVAPALAAICSKALSRDSSKRYRDMSELATDLRAYLEDRVVQAYATGPWAEARTWLRRNRAAAASVAAGLLVGIAGLQIAVLGLSQARLERSVRLELEQQNYVSSLALADQDPAAAGRFLERCPPDLRGWEWDHLALKHDLSALVLEGHEGAVLGVALSPDLTRCASASKDGSVRVWDFQTGHCTQIIEIGAERQPVYAVAFLSDGYRLVVGAADRFVRTFDANSGELLLELGPMNDEVRAVRPGPDGRIAAASLDGEILEWATPSASDASTRLATGYSRLVESPALAYLDNPPSYHLFAASGAGAIVYDLSSGQNQTVTLGRGLASGTNRSLAGVKGLPSRWLTAAAVSAGGIVAWTEFTEQTVFVDSLRADNTIRLARSEEPIVAMALDARGELLALGSNDGKITIWDLNQPAPIRVLRGHQGTVTSLDVSPDGGLLVSGSADGTARVWQRGVTEAQSVLLGQADLVRTQFLDDQRLAMLNDHGRVCILDSQSGRVLSDERHSSFITLNVADPQDPLTFAQYWRSLPALFTRDGSRLVLGDMQGMARCTDIESRNVTEVRIHDSAVTCLDLDATEEWLASGSRDGSVRIWTWPHMEPFATITENGGPAVTAMTYAPGGDWLAWGTEDGFVKRWDLERGEQIDEWAAYEGPVRVLLALPGGRLLTGTNSPKVRVWSLDRKDSLFTLTLVGPDDKSVPTTIGYNSDASRVVAGTNNGTVVLWESKPKTASAWNTSWAAGPHDLTPPPVDLFESVADLTVHRLVDRLFDKHLFLDSVMLALREQPLSQRELQLAARRAEEKKTLSGAELAEIAWDISREMDRSEQYRTRAVVAAQAACVRDPGVPWYRVVLGAAELRAGDGIAAEATLTQVLGSVDRGSPEKAIAHAFRALALQTLGRRDDARAELARARSAAGASSSLRAVETVRALESEIP